MRSAGEEGGCGAFMNWNARQSFRVKVISTVILGILMICEHWLFIGIPIGGHGILIFIGLLGIGFHAWFLGSLMNTVYHDGRKHRRIIVAHQDKMDYIKYSGECWRREEAPMTEEEWAKKHGMRTIQVQSR